jgi:hypothetical protein
MAKGKKLNPEGAGGGEQDDRQQRFDWVRRCSGGLRALAWIAIN